MSRTKHKEFCSECDAFLARYYAVCRGKALPPQVAEIRRNQALLLQAWSVMAGRNLMNDVLRSLGALEPSLPPELKADYAKLRQNLLRLLQSHAIGKARYESVLCVGYRVKTTGSSYSGGTDDYADMQARCDDLKAAIRSAHNLVTRSGTFGTNAKVLKIFMAPEFYFRGRNGAYDATDVSGQKARKAGQGVSSLAAKPGLIDILAQELQQDIYDDWLFVLGTAIVATKAVRTVCKVDYNHKLKFPIDRSTGKTKPECTVDKNHGTYEGVYGAQIDNVAFVWKEGEVHMLSKELVSDKDFIKSPTQSNLVTVKVDGVAEELPVMPWGDGAASKFKDERMGGSIFTIDGVTFGLEVCLDHKASKASFSAGRLDHAANIQVQLIPSAGMTINRLRTVAGGIVFNVDGDTPHVQVVAGQDSAPGATKVSKQEIRYDQVSGGTELEFAFTGTKPGNFSGDLDDLAKNHNAGWSPVQGASKQTPTLPKLAHGNSGSILLYGPYELPSA